MESIVKSKASCGGTPGRAGNLVLILDYGSQYTHLITRRIRLHRQAEASRRRPFRRRPLRPRRRSTLRQEYGKMEIAVAEGEWGLYGPEAIGGHQTVWMSRGDEAVKLPKGFSLVARSLQGSVAAIENHSGMIYGLQYHPEVTHSTQGMETLWHFLLDVCGITADWKMQGVLEEEIKVIKGVVGPDEHVICALSGGVDSTDAATLVHKVIGNRLHCVFVDNGLLRLHVFLSESCQLFRVIYIYQSLILMLLSNFLVSSKALKTLR
ncbi:unnamed protein product [Musa banksii]